MSFACGGCGGVTAGRGGWCGVVVVVLDCWCLLWMAWRGEIMRFLAWFCWMRGGIEGLGM